MAVSSQHKRVRKNRVSITYDVETNGALETKELPFVVGVIGDFAGSKPEDQRQPLEDREFTQIDKDNFNEVMGRIGPELSVKVDNKLAKEGEQSDLQVDLKFNTMKDFEPEQIVQQVDPLRKLLDTRNQLKVLLSKADRSRDLEKLLQDILQNNDALGDLSKELGIEVPEKEGD
ncbi:type VI secretion system contractile sheath small subunit [Sansalvadorimonas sp. 2012CJ34-2]|uniref:Type VI secretion system contractile sheath small subunit n=1 Tax=Parendozoicomonas callyspongiae TaxID=2942213 RepID=A0ABT0PIL6_9GAMM|nr:type VI secretion system contractile sheath small subunit [Sansalvadorimonas sp. 2012CJ34-2]MCL6271101.1 type VI secretion system contractile sheath small subunit [Sansalvadorimonas sp. 2012CJ34-2]